MICMSIAFRIEASLCGTSNLLDARKYAVSVLPAVSDNTVDSRDVAVADCNHQSRMSRKMPCADEKGLTECQRRKFQTVNLVIFLAEKTLGIAHSQVGEGSARTVPIFVPF
jgi:hypothetical protein